MIWNVYFWPVDHLRLKLKAEFLGRVRAKDHPRAIRRAWDKYPERPKARLGAYPRTVDPFFRGSEEEAKQALERGPKQ